MLGWEGLGTRLILHDGADYTIMISVVYWNLCIIIVLNSPWWWSCERYYLPVGHHCLLWPSLVVYNMYLDWGEPYATYKHLGNKACCMYVLVDIIRESQAKYRYRLPVVCFTTWRSADFRSWKLLSRRLSYVCWGLITHTCLLLKMIHMTQSPLTHLIRHMLCVTTYSRCTKPIHVYWLGYLVLILLPSTKLYELNAFLLEPCTKASTLS